MFGGGISSRSGFSTGRVFDSGWLHMAVLSLAIPNSAHNEYNTDRWCDMGLRKTSQSLTLTKNIINPWLFA